MGEGKGYIGLGKKWRKLCLVLLLPVLMGLLTGAGWQEEGETPYVYAIVITDRTGKEEERICESYADRESLLKAFSEKKAAVLREETDRIPWFFVKMRMDDSIHALSVYQYVQYHLSEEGYKDQALTMAHGSAFEITQEWTEALESTGMVYPKREIIIRDGYLYSIACGKVTEENREAVREQLFYLEDQLVPGNIGGIGMDEETLYWVDHTERVRVFEDPSRRFTEKRAVDVSWDDRIMQFFALMSEAEYDIRIAPDLPEMTVSFRFAEEIPEEGYETYLLNGFCMDEPYHMEVRVKKDGTLLQAEDVELNIHYIDTVCFEDLNGDGFLDMRIFYLIYGSGYDGRDVKYENNWLWNPDRQKFEKKGRKTPPRHPWDTGAD